MNTFSQKVNAAVHALELHSVALEQRHKSTDGPTRLNRLVTALAAKPDLKHLSLASCTWNENDYIQLLKALAQHQKLITLSLPDTVFTEAAWTALCEYIGSAKYLENLSLKNVAIGAGRWHLLLAALNSNTTLKTVSLIGTDMDGGVFIQLFAVLLNHPHLKVDVRQNPRLVQDPNPAVADIGTALLDSFAESYSAKYHRVPPWVSDLRLPLSCRQYLSPVQQIQQLTPTEEATLLATYKKSVAADRDGILPSARVPALTN